MACLRRYSLFQKDLDEKPQKPDHMNARCPPTLSTDTIAAIATPIGQGGIGIIRLSGPESLGILKKIFRPKHPISHFKSHRLYLGHLIDPQNGLYLDEVLVSFMRAPHTYTREDVVEINSHSGYFILSKILEVVLEAGARLAEPGEFTMRAYLNGRIDLSQAEAVVDLINSRSEWGLHLASKQIQGSLSNKINTLRDQIIQILGQIEAAIDFPEEEDVILEHNTLISNLSEQVIPQITNLIEAHNEKRIWFEGINAVIAGRVNVGKSSLLNRILDKQRAIVTAVPGTTRDIIESNLSIQGVPIRLMDTAGIREASDEIEKIGVQLTEKKLEEADLVLAVMDQSLPITQEDIRLVERLEGKAALVVLNKIDLPSAMDWGQVLKGLCSFPCVKVSALTGQGISELKKQIVKLVIGDDKLTSPSAIAPNLRQTKALKDAQQSLQNALKCIKDARPLEIIAFEIRNALDSLGQIVGETTSDQVLESIFSNFCIGK